MLISIHSHALPLTVHVSEILFEDAVWIDFGIGQSIQLSAEEAAHLCTMLEDGLAQIDQRDAVRQTELDVDPLASLPLFEDEHA